MERCRRRDFLRSSAVAAGALAFGPSFWREALAVTAQPGPGPYGPLQPRDANGLMLPRGFQSRVIARGGQRVGATSYIWHPSSDGQATYATGDGGWILVSNAETLASRGGGSSAIRFRSDGSIRSAYRILGGTNTNCAGGATPWGTWLSCEEHDRGRVWECDPTGARAAVVRPAMGVFKHEAAAVDPGERRVYLTEDQPDGAFYRFTPLRYPDLSSGVLEVAMVTSNGIVSWKPVPDPAATVLPTRRQVPGSTIFKRAEGIWFDSGVVYIATTADNRIQAYDTSRRVMEVVYDAAALTSPPLTGVDNVIVSRSGDLFVCEDNAASQLDIGIITPARQVARFLTATGALHTGSELTGVVFAPSGTRMYLASQRGFGGPGAVLEVRGPFRLTRPPA
jgi:secreted PhoX family phosphatase